MSGHPLGLGALAMQQASRLQMATGALGRGYVLLDGLADHGVNEAQRLAVQQHLHRGQGVGGGAGLGDAQSRELGRMSQGDVIPQDGHRAGQRGGLAAQPAHTDAQRAGHGVRGQGANTLLELGSDGRRLLLERQEQLVQVERVTRGGIPAGLGQRLVGWLAEQA